MWLHGDRVLTVLRGLEVRISLFNSIKQVGCLEEAIEGIEGGKEKITN